MPQHHERRHRFQLDPQTDRIAQRAIGIRETVEQIGVFVGGGRGDDVTAAGEHVDLDDRFVRQAVAERRRLDAEPGDRAAERDGLQLRDHQG
mgnify:CR=1 FL=1